MDSYQKLVTKNNGKHCPTSDIGNLKVNSEHILSPREFRSGNSCVIGTVSEEDLPILGEDMCLVPVFKIA